MLTEVIDWLKKNSAHQITLNVNEFTKSVVIDIDNDSNLARLVFWDDNSCMLEVMNINTGEYILNERHELSDVKDFVNIYAKFERSLT
ncbi:hypothetical protein [Erwinia sp. ErVv1]|uniref:immunity protein TriTu family protein n=1 Tax=Erwinia sp. ErVv1 TaxID=1603299 RepID=UPI000834BF1C|nr:hypothetical protein [Erwinia sp. ErVv1]